MIFLFSSGGVSHVDSFDPKPRLIADHGKQIAADHPEIKNRAGYEKIFLKRPQWEFAPHGQCGTEVANQHDHWESYRMFTAPINWRLESGDRFEFNVVPTGERLDAPFDIADSVTIPPGS